MTEKDYDEIVAPMLLAVVEKCRELGMTLIARCEWEPGESGITQTGDFSTSAGQFVTHAAAHAHGNIDAMCMHLLRTQDCSASVVLAPWQKERPSR